MSPNCLPSDVVQTNKMEAAFLIGIAFSVCSLRFLPQFSCLFGVKQMEDDKIPQEARGHLGKLWREDSTEGRVVLFEGADESVLEIRGACLKAVIRGMDGCVEVN